MIRHFTATTYVVQNSKVLLHYHRKLDMILPLGGHIEPNELPDEAAKREIKEECGLDVTLLSEHPPAEELGDEKVAYLCRPSEVLLEQIAPDHFHIDLIYFGHSADGVLDPACVKEQGLRWYDVADLKQPNIPPEVRALGARAINAVDRALRRAESAG